VIRTATILQSVILSVCINSTTRAAQIQLPPIGTNTNHNYGTGGPNLHVVENAPTGNFWQSELTFASGQHLFVEFENVPPTPHVMQIDLLLHGTGLRDLFEPIHILFNEQLSLIMDGGATIDVPKNTGVGYRDDDPDYYVFSWTVEPPDYDFSIHGLQWNITPDLVGGAVLPSTLDAQLSLFANGAIWVVPEPSGSAAIVVLSAYGLRRRRCRSGCA
jgi:hypothetical protein